MDIRTVIVPIVTNKVINKTNIKNIIGYITHEMTFYYNFNKEIYIQDYPSTIYELFDVPDLEKSIKKNKQTNSILYDDINQLLNIKLDDVLIKSIGENIDPITSTIEPFEHIIEIFSNIYKNTPENYSIILVLNKNVVLGSISIMVDSRITLYNKPIGYFIGIRKTYALMIAQEYVLLYNVKISSIIKFKLSNVLIPLLEKYTVSLGGKYLVVQPLPNMEHILQTYFGFIKYKNIIQYEYTPPLEIITFKNENILYKQLI